MAAAARPLLLVLDCGGGQWPRQPIDLISERTRITPLDVILGVLLLAGALFVFQRMAMQLQYEWRWATIWQYLFRYDDASDRWVANYLMKGFYTTIRLSLWGTLLATLIGTGLGLARVSTRLFRRMVGTTYVELIRNLPPLVLIFIVYFFISDQIMPLLRIQDWVEAASPPTRAVLEFLFGPSELVSTFMAAMVTLALFEGAYITEIVRAGIQSIEKGQWEASAAMGFSYRGQMLHVILPQAVRRILPPLAGQFISTIKDSAIVSVISIQDLTFQGMELMAATYMTFEIWITITLLYLLLTLSCSLAIRWLEKFINRHRFYA